MSAQPALRSLAPPVLLPDGSEFKTWEQPLHFERTYYVDQAHPGASDADDGTRDRPFATINRAAQVLGPGERVVVGSGVYREWVRPARGGSGPDRMISYEAAPGAEVVIKGSREFRGPWRASTVVRESGADVWEAKLDPALFDGYHPFAIDNVTPEQFGAMDWATPLRGKPPYTLARGLVFQDGVLLRQAATPEEVGTGTYWVDRPNAVLHLRLTGDQSPERANLEITTQATVFAPVEPGLGYIRVRGFTIEHAAGPFPWEQVGALSTTRGHHWIIEDNVVRWANGVGMDLGIQHPGWPQPPVVGFHIVRRNVVTDCGICGICGLGPARGRDFGLLIEDNAMARNAFYDVERLYETGGIKTHNNIRCLIRRNLIVDTLHGAGIWMDWNNQFSRCTANVIVNSHTIHGGIFIEASYRPNLIDQNVIWGTEGHGIYEHDSFGQIFAHNLIVGSSQSGVHLQGKITDRRVDGREMVYGKHSVWNNVLVDNAKPNELLGEPSNVAGNVEAGATAQLDRQRMALSWDLPEAATRCLLVTGVTHDFLGGPRVGVQTCAGPFAKPAGTNEALGRWPAPTTGPALAGLGSGPIHLRIDFSKPDGRWDMPALALGQGGLQSDPMIQPHLKEIRELRPRTIRLFLSEYYRIYPDHGVYDFTRLDRELQTVRATGARPTLALAMKPPILFPVVDHFQVHPNNYAEWEALCEALARHCRAAGFEVAAWEVCNEPDIGEGGGTPQYFTRAEDYNTFYDHTVAGVRRGDPDAFVGGPAVANADSLLVEGLIQHCATSNVPFDFLSWHLYSDSAEHHAANIDKQRARLSKHPQLKDVKLFISEWNMNLSNPNLAPGFQPALVLETMRRYAEAGLDMAAYYHIRDCFVDPADFDWMSSGGRRFMAHWWNTMPQYSALFDHHGRVRPAWYAFRFLSRFAGDRYPVEGERGAIRAIAGDGDGYKHVLLWRYEDAGADEVEVRVELIGLGDRFTRVVELDPLAQVNNIKVIRTAPADQLGGVPIRLQPWGIRWIEIE